MNKPLHVRKYGFAVPISREMALDWGLVEPTEDEKRKRDAYMAAWRTKVAAARPGILSAVAALDALTGPERVILDLHRQEPNAYGFGECEGCDFSGYECEPPAWPCRTVEAIAGMHGIDVSNFHLFHLYDGQESQ